MLEAIMVNPGRSRMRQLDREFIALFLPGEVRPCELLVSEKPIDEK
jgi:hypothetical protein